MPITRTTGRVAFIMPNYSHDDVRISHKEARTLHEMGCEVILVCREPPARSYLGMTTVAARVWPQSTAGIFFSLPLLLLQTFRLRAHIHVLTNPYSLILGILLALLGKRVIYVTHEDFEQRVELRPQVPKPLRRIVGRTIVLCERLISRLAVATIVTQPNVRSRYRNAHLIENAPLKAGPVVEQAEKIYAELRPPATPTLVYAGAITRHRGLFRMLDLAVLLNAKRPWRLELLGRVFPGSDLDAARRHPGWRYVEYRGQVPHSVSLAHIRSAQIGLGLLDDVGGYSKASMTKLYEYMLMETPFVVSDFEWWRESIRHVPAGLFVDVNDMNGTARQIEALLEDTVRYAAMKRAGRQFIEHRFNWDLSAEPFIRVVAEWLPGSHCSSESMSPDQRRT